MELSQIEQLDRVVLSNLRTFLSAKDLWNLRLASPELHRKIDLLIFNSKEVLYKPLWELIENELLPIYGSYGPPFYYYMTNRLGAVTQMCVERDKNLPNTEILKSTLQFYQNNLMSLKNARIAPVYSRRVRQVEKIKQQFLEIAIYIITLIESHHLIPAEAFQLWQLLHAIKNQVSDINYDEIRNSDIPRLRRNLVIIHRLSGRVLPYAGIISCICLLIAFFIPSTAVLVTSVLILAAIIVLIHAFTPSNLPDDTIITDRYIAIKSGFINNLHQRFERIEHNINNRHTAETANEAVDIEVEIDGDIELDDLEQTENMNLLDYPTPALS